MPDDEARPDGAATGVEIVKAIAKEGHIELTVADLAVLSDAFDVDSALAIAAAAATAASAKAAAEAAVTLATAAAAAAAAAEVRFEKLEQQTRALADAVIAITEPSEAVAPAVAIVKENM